MTSPPPSADNQPSADHPPGSDWAPPSSSVGPPPGPPADQVAQDQLLLAAPSRQSPIAVAFMALKFVRNLGAVQLGVAFIFLISGRVPTTLLIGGSVACLIGLVYMALAWLRFTFEVRGDELLVSKGVVAQERLTIPLDRVQSVSIDQGFFHRLIGLVSASVDTAGSSAAEFEIDAIDRQLAEALQRLVAGHRRSSPTAGLDPVGEGGGGQPIPAAAPDRVLIKRNLGDLVRIGISGWPWAGLVALAPLFAMAGDLQNYLPWDSLEDQRVVEDNLPSEFGPRLVGAVLALAIVGILLITFLGGALQIVREVVTNWDLTLTKTTTGLRRTAGLFSKTSKASTVNRIQAIQTDQTPVQRILGIRKLTLPTIGEGDLAIPGATGSEVEIVRAIVFDGKGTVSDGKNTAPPYDRKISRLAVFLAVRNRFLVAGLLTIALFSPFGWWVLLIPLSIPLEWLVARRRWRLRRWSLSSWRIAESYEFVNKHTAELDLIKTQTVSVSRSFFERRRGLATVRIETAEGHLAVPLITIEEAMAVRDRALFVAESDRRSWM